MKLGLLYEIQIPKPWTPGIEARTYSETIDQIVLADRLGWGYVWAVEHHLLPQWSHCSAPEILFGALSQRTSQIRIGHGIALLPKNFNHALRVAERIAIMPGQLAREPPPGFAENPLVSGRRRTADTSPPSSSSRAFVRRRSPSVRARACASSRHGSRIPDSPSDSRTSPDASAHRPWSQ